MAFRLAVAGSKGDLQVWDTSTNAGVRQAFGNRIGSKIEGGGERIIRIQEDSSDGEEAEPGGVDAAGGWETEEDA